MIHHRRFVIACALVLCTFSCSHSHRAGNVKIDIGGYRTCGGQCGTLRTDSTDNDYCDQAKDCTDNNGCGCHIFDTKGEDDMKKWKHVWAPGDVRPSHNDNHRCVCAKEKD